MLLFLLYFTEQSFRASQRTFRAMSQQTFKKWKPGVWAALNTGLCTLEEEEEDERGQAIQIQKGMPSSSLEEQHLASYANVRLSLYKSPSDPSGQSLSWLP